MRNFLWVVFLVIVIFIFYNFFSGALHVQGSIQISYDSMQSQIALASLK